MKSRHKPPTLVSMWMLDVFCCALGCVTLLWLLNTREAADQAKRAGAALEILARTGADLRRAQDELLSTRADLDRTRRALNAEIEDLQGKLVLMTTERDETATKLAATNAELDETQKRLVATAAHAIQLDDELAQKNKAAEDLAAKLALSARSADELTRLLRARERERDDLALKAKSAEDQLTDLDARLRALLEESREARSNLAASKKTGDELAAAARDLQRKLDEASATIIDLQGQKAKLADKFDRLHRDAENRFAGIAMTGRRVVFVIDTSGSMKRVAEKAPDPAKWPGVVETVAKVMRTLPDLEKFQVVTFSEKAQFLLDRGDGWIDFRGEPTVQRVTAALTALEPTGGTNLHDAFERAFRFRRDGLDAVYLFSDGLSNVGPGLAPGQERLPAVEQSEILSRYVLRVLATDWNRPGPGPRVRINAIGFFFESPDLGAFLWTLARENDGSFVGMSKP